jgi:P pilus assembly chaperone PapD
MNLTTLTLLACPAILTSLLIVANPAQAGTTVNPTQIATHSDQILAGHSPLGHFGYL